MPTPFGSLPARQPLPDFPAHPRQLPHDVARRLLGDRETESLPREERRPFAILRERGAVELRAERALPWPGKRSAAPIGDQLEEAVSYPASGPAGVRIGHHGGGLVRLQQAP